jgi:alpha-tubulin suppressor-like RCC1 family protein
VTCKSAIPLILSLFLKLIDFAPGGTKDVLSLQDVKKLSHEKIVHVAAGAIHSVFVASTGRVHVCGDNRCVSSENEIAALRWLIFTHFHSFPCFFLWILSMQQLGLPLHIKSKNVPTLLPPAYINHFSIVEARCLGMGTILITGDQ